VAEGRALDDTISRAATRADAEEVADIDNESRKAFVSFAPLVHSETSVRSPVRADRATMRVLRGTDTRTSSGNGAYHSYPRRIMGKHSALHIMS
jgi:hypothetical protein